MSLTSYAEHRVSRSSVVIKAADASEVAAAAAEFQSLGASRAPSLWIEKCGAEACAAALKAWPDASDVSLRYCDFEDLAPVAALPKLEALAGLPALERIDLTKATGVTSVACLSECPKLKRVECSKNAFPEDEVAALDAALKARGKGNRVNVR